MDKNMQGLTKCEGTLQIKPLEINLSPFKNLATSEILYGIDYASTKEDRGVLDKIDRYIINKNATIIFWKDGNKTISRVDVEDVFNKEIGFMLAVYKYLGPYGVKTKWSKSELKKELDCIKAEKMYDYLFINFNKYTFKDTNKAKRYLSELKVEKSKKKSRTNVNASEHKKIFSKEKFIEKEGENHYLWVDECDGKEVINGRIGCYLIVDEWCEVK